MRLTFQCIAMVLQCCVTYLNHIHLLVRYRECCKEEQIYLEMITLMYFLWFTAWRGQNEVLAPVSGLVRGRADLDGEFVA